MQEIKDEKGNVTQIIFDNLQEYIDYVLLTDSKLKESMCEETGVVKEKYDCTGKYHLTDEAKKEIYKNFYNSLVERIVEIDNDPDNGDDYYFIVLDKTKASRELLDILKDEVLYGKRK